MKTANQQRPLTIEEYDWLKKMRPAVDEHWDELTGFEKQFIESLLQRFDQYGMRTMISQKQWEIVTAISEKVM